MNRQLSMDEIIFLKDIVKTFTKERAIPSRESIINNLQELVSKAQERNQQLLKGIETEFLVKNIIMYMYSKFFLPLEDSKAIQAKLSLLSKKMKTGKGMSLGCHFRMLLLKEMNYILKANDSIFKPNKTNLCMSNSISSEKENCLGESYTFDSEIEDKWMVMAAIEEMAREQEAKSFFFSEQSTSSPTFAGTKLFLQQKLGLSLNSTLEEPMRSRSRVANV